MLVTTTCLPEVVNPMVTQERTLKKLKESRSVHNEADRWLNGGVSLARGLNGIFSARS